MELTINNVKLNKKIYKPAFKGLLDGALTGVLRTLDTNAMANAAVLDVGTMVIPRTYFDTKDRNKYAGGETFIREICGTLINCFAAGAFGVLISKAANKLVNKNVKINTNSWFSEDSLALLKHAWDNSGNKTQRYVENVLDAITGYDGTKKTEFKNIDWNNVEWYKNNKWGEYLWKNPEYKHFENRIKTKDGFIKNFARVILDKDIDKQDKKQIFEIFETRLTNALKANRDIEVCFGDKKLSGTLGNILRDTYDIAHDVFTNDKADVNAVLKKIKKVNNIKIFGALTLASLIGINVQRFNRKLTEKRSGKKGFVGDVDYMTRDNITECNKAANDKKGLTLKKILASVGMVAMVLGVMKVKNPKDFVKKLQFTGPVSTGNAIKTVYMATILGRFLAADNNNELRESVVRDYFGFLNWLVLGGFAAKGIGNILDPKKEALFNINKEGKGIKHWLNNVSLKTHEEIAAHGKEFAKKNLWKLNVAHIGGLAYSTLMLGMILPKINTKMTQHKAKLQQTQQNEQINEQK